jgi:hypothetical protein
MTQLRRPIRLLGALAMASSAACATLGQTTLLQQADRDWGPTLTRSRAVARDGRPAQADSLLAQYAAAYPSAPQAIEASYWRALLDIGSPTTTQRTSLAIPLLQTYVAAGPATEHWMEADGLLRAVCRVDTLSRVAATYISRGEVSIDAAAAATAKAADAKAIDAKTATADTKAQNDEIRRLTDELAKSKDELDRIKKRLAEPPKKPPM